MTAESNKKINTEPKVVPEESIPKKESKLGKAFKIILGGDLISEGTFKFYKYLFFLAFLAFIYIANNYHAEKNIRQINKLRKEIKVLRYEYINVKTKLMQIEKQSQIEKKLVKKGIIKNNQPIKTITIK